MFKKIILSFALISALTCQNALGMNGDQPQPSRTELVVGTGLALSTIAAMAGTVYYLGVIDNRTRQAREQRKSTFQATLTKMLAESKNSIGLVPATLLAATIRTRGEKS